MVLLMYKVFLLHNYLNNNQYKYIKRYKFTYVLLSIPFTFFNLFSFTHYNTINENEILKNPSKSIDLWSISRWSYPRYKGTATFIASYNYYTQIYTFAGKNYLLYDDLVKDALNF